MNLKIIDNQAIIPSELIGAKNGDIIEIIKQSHNTFLLKIRPKKNKSINNR